MFTYAGNAVAEFTARQLHADRLREAEQDRLARLAEHGRARPRLATVLETARETIAAFRRSTFRPSPGLAR